MSFTFRRTASRRRLRPAQLFLRQRARELLEQVLLFFVSFLGPICAIA